MFGLRQKLLMGFGGLVFILLVISGVSIAVAMKNRRTLNDFFVENWRSVEYGQAMVDAITDIDSVVGKIGGDPTPAELAGVHDAIQPDIAVFNENLSDENHNITLDGEAEIAGHLTNLWSS